MPVRRRSAVAIYHIEFEDLGLLKPILEREGWTVSYRDAKSADLTDASITGADLLIVLGGPMGVYDAYDYPFLRREADLLGHRLAHRLPTLGICLGSQLMASALGAAVYPGVVKEIGWGPVTLTAEGEASCLAPLAEGASVLHWHGDTFDLPDGASRLASTMAYENQAFAYGPHGLGLQFHLEVEPAQLEDWYTGHAAELEAAGLSIPDLRSATAKAATDVRRIAEAVFSRWLTETG